MVYTAFFHYLEFGIMAKKVVYLVDGNRTPILKAKGPRNAFTASDLAVEAGRPLISRHGLDSNAFDEVILGCAMPSEKEANIARVASLRLGLSELTPAWTVHRNCASGMQAVDSAVNRIQNGDADLILAGGTEAMSHAPLMFNNGYVNFLLGLMKAKSVPQKLAALSMFRFKFLKPIFALEHGLTDPVCKLNMGQTAEKVAERFAISRQEMDEFAVASHMAAVQALEEGCFKDEMTSIIDKKGHLYEHDLGVRADSNVEKLSTLKAVFDKPHGKVTAANSSQISDGACWLMLASSAAVKKHGLKPIAKITEVAWAGLDPSEMGLGPVHASAKLLANQNMQPADVDYWEINEAFAAQVLGCLRAFASEDYGKEKLGLDSALGALDESKVNIHGGAVACGHPVGMSGARIILHLAHTLKQKQAKRGIATLCIGGGQGGATMIELV